MIPEYVNLTVRSSHDLPARIAAIKEHLDNQELYDRPVKKSDIVNWAVELLELKLKLRRDAEFR